MNWICVRESSLLRYFWVDLALNPIYALRIVTRSFSREKGEPSEWEMLNKLETEKRAALDRIANYSCINAMRYARRRTNSWLRMQRSKMNEQWEQSEECKSAVAKTITLECRSKTLLQFLPLLDSSRLVIRNRTGRRKGTGEMQSLLILVIESSINEWLNWPWRLCNRQHMLQHVTS